MIIYDSPNHWPSRNGNKPRAIVLHTTGAPFDSVVNTFLNPKTEKSAHYLIDRKGRLYRFVQVDYPAWHAGRVNQPIWKNIRQNINPNLYTIGIELEATREQYITTKQYITCALLVAQLSERHGIPLHPDYIIPHGWIDQDKLFPSLKVSPDAVIALAKMFREYI